MRWTREQYNEYLKRRAQVGVNLCSGGSEPAQANALGGSVQGETKSVQRIAVRFIFYRHRLWHDRDNYSSAAKDLQDGLQHAGLLPGDSEREIDLQVDQVKVAHRTEQKTVVTITYP